jgi:hypothetical protein
MFRAPIRAGLLAVVLALAACSAGAEQPIDNDDPTPPGSPANEPVLVVQAGGADTPFISVADFLRRSSDTPVLVTGALFVDADGTVRLCDAIAESFPPQCGGERVVVQGLDLATMPDLQSEGDVRWAERASVFGRIAVGG